MESNFSFLKEQFSYLYECILKAEKEYKYDFNVCMYKVGQFAELITKRMIEVEGLKTHETTQKAYIQALKRNELIGFPLDDMLHRIRKQRNNAVHENFSSKEEAEILLNTHLS